MKKCPHFLAAAGLLAALVSGPSLAAVGVVAEGTIVKLEGHASVERAGQSLPIAENFSIASGDVLQVEKDSKVQIHMQDDSLFAIPGPAVFSIDSFKMPGADGPGEALYTLKSGALRTITGKINKGGGKYQMRAAPATVTVNGSAYSALLCGSCAGFADGLYVKDESGVIGVGNGGGSVKLKPGQVAFVPAGGGAPALVTKSPFNDPKFAAKFGADFKLNQTVNPPRIENEKPASPS